MFFFWVTTARASPQNIPHKITVTAFTLSKKECGGNIKKTAIGRKPMSGRTAAVSRDMIHLLGHKAYVEGLGVWNLESVSKKGLKNTIDLLVATKYQATQIGRKSRRWAVL